MSPRVERLVFLEAVIAEQAIQPMVAPELTFAEMMEYLFASRYTGRVTLDLHEGRPRRLELPNPVLVRMVERS